MHRKMWQHFPRCSRKTGKNNDHKSNEKWCTRSLWGDLHADFQYLNGDGKKAEEGLLCKCKKKSLDPCENTVRSEYSKSLAKCRTSSEQQYTENQGLWKN